MNTRRRDRNEVAAALPVDGAFCQTQVGFVDKRGWLKRVAGTFPSHVGARESVQLCVDQRQQLFTRVRLPAAHCLE